MSSSSLPIVMLSSRAEHCTTPALLDAEGIDYRVIVDDDAAYARYVAAGRVDRARIIIAGTKGVVPGRKWIYDTLFQPGEWYISLDDNIQGWSALPDPYYRLADTGKSPAVVKAFRTECSAAQFIARLTESVEEAKQRHAFLVGCALVDNGYFRTKKYRDVGVVKHKASAICKTEAQYDTHILASEDYDFSGEHLLTFGRLLINNYLFPLATHYQPGGIGTYEERLPRKIQDMAYLMAKFDGLFRYKEKAGCDPRAEIQVRFTSQAQVDKWRHTLGAPI